jgi:hypothetical protein
MLSWYNIQLMITHRGEFHIITSPETLSSDFFYKDSKAAFTSNNITIESDHWRKLSSPAVEKELKIDFHNANTVDYF